ncbi:DNA-directed DNA polymerase epsilon, subunit B [Spiromyces aspiralis]|uniref:DNA-directed DNA polymerase epsilon, subunit B n=1 Tax=Spiromyces aspiralis TaxID=68401 RepID=A0ACC1HHV3_9FUNG|nr:DNA-directed DNA polymerase epsilon, subunit B [Spiromyces aspiralis]
MSTSSPAPPLPRPAAKRLVYKVFTKRFSLSLKVDSSQYLEDQLYRHGFNRDNAEEWLNSVAETWIQLHSNRPLVELEPLKDTLKSLDLKNSTKRAVAAPSTISSQVADVEDEKRDLEAIGEFKPLDYFHVIDAYDVPTQWYDTKTHQFGNPFEGFDILSGAEAKTALLRQRYDVIKQRILHNDNFAPSTFRSKNRDDSQALKLDTIESLQGREGDNFLLFGMLAQLEEGKVYLEDKDGSVELDLSQVVTDSSATGVFTEACFALVDGYYQDGVFHVEELGLPPPERKEKTLSFYPDVNFFGGPTVLHEKASSTLKHLETANDTVSIVILSEVWLDKPNVVSALKMLFAGYASAIPPMAFIFLGDFCSVPFVSGSGQTQRYKELWSDFADLIAQYRDIANNSQFVFLPGPNDPWGVGAYPSPPIANFFTQKMQSKIKHVRFTTNPCRIQYCTQEITVFREDLLKKLHRNCMVPAASGQQSTSMVKHMVRTIIDQGHLCPLPAHIQPLYWAYDHAMRLYPIPDVVMRFLAVYIVTETTGGKL